MELTNLTVKVIGEEKSGTSMATGRKWSNRCIVLGFLDQDGSENFISATVVSDVWAQSGITQTGTLVKANLAFRTKSFNSGYVANEVHITNIQML